MRKEIIHSSWEPLMHILNQEAITQLDQIRLEKQIYPEDKDVFRVFSMPLNEIKVVILGQDPYYTRGAANGLAFAVNSSFYIPPSLKIIAQEIEQEGLKSGFFDSDIDEWKTLEHWEEQGVFLLNTALTVEDQKPGSHMKIWSTFISTVITFIAFRNPCVWLLWGKPAQKLALGAMRFKDIETFDFSLYKKEDISTMPFSPYYNYILASAHPAAEVYRQNAGFLGNDHFIKTNALLSLKNKKIINW